ncbi:MAG: ion transporter [Planctomycetaceae bacterium]|nr:ion transporter [Planctomycetaceae bacterium]
MKSDKLEPRDTPLARTLYEVIFEADTFAGKAIDLALLVLIVVSVMAVSIETIDRYDTEDYRPTFLAVEWTCTILFTLEYAVRIWCLKRPLAYVFSFFGIVDLLSFLPAYVGIAASQLLGKDIQRSSFAVIRALRLLRVFRVLELSWFESEANSLRKAVWDARAKVVVFFMTVLIIVTIAGAAMYEIEHVPGPEGSSDFESIPQSIYWAIITMTTVGYGDVVPQTTLGKLVAAILVLLGYSLIIVPTGFVSAELGVTKRQGGKSRSCPQCERTEHHVDANFCDACGTQLPVTP